MIFLNPALKGWVGLSINLNLLNPCPPLVLDLNLCINECALPHHVIKTRENDRYDVKHVLRKLFHIGQHLFCIDYDLDHRRMQKKKMWNKIKQCKIVNSV